MVGGAAITEELRPGFWFTTFSYALSLLRPQIVHELELHQARLPAAADVVRFAPTEDGEYLWFTKDHDREPARDRAHLSPHDADAYEQYGHDLDRGLPGDQAAARPGAARPVQRRPRGAAGARRPRARASATWTSGRCTTPSGC